MANAASLTAPGLSATDLLATKAPGKLSANTEAKARSKAQDFEAMFLNSMFQHMFTGLNGDGPMGGQGATGVWRSMLTDQFARTIAKSGGIGIADQVYRSLIAHQEAST
ncbi:flagellar rod assembly protein FlgJ [Pseudolabrys taiwanensis]|uniref:Flagellar rod assembly protein FlgJ n=1 Tax=Pseudolabrys taiwanensis TaxID=331696 RepID=A0A345ZQI0_9HYPH|nr:flagellar assembly peptidoglycan hydrolase FlgJ [Pseudolabrys taiwanensis]AXK79177.1 flagellar rod assembly protein FlgJ [Pseudolabrys taiwanensis]